MTRSTLFHGPAMRGASRRYGVIVGVIFAGAVIAFILLGMAGGLSSPTGLQECKGTTGIYREYDEWDGEYETYTVPDDPACGAR